MNNNILYHRNFRENGQAFPFVTNSNKNDGNVTINNIDYENGKMKMSAAPTIAGMLTGAAISGVMTNNYLKNEDNRRMAEETRLRKNAPTVEGDYYKQVNNVVNNLDVVFTPISAIFLVNNKDKTFTLDTIEVDEMNDIMRKAWRNKDKNFYKDMLVNKMYSEVMLAEETFAKRFLKNHKGINKMLNKNASDDISDFCIKSEIEKLSSFYDGTDIKTKLAVANITDVDSSVGEIDINLKLDRPFTKYAGFLGSVTDCIGMHNELSHNGIVRHLNNPVYLMKNIKVGFFPDRVIFTLDNSLVSTLSLIGMNEEGYQKFTENDEKYFRNLFVQQSKSNMKKNSKFEKIAMEFEKTNDEIIDCLTSAVSHPVAIHLLLVDKLGHEWFMYDMGIIEEIIKREFDIKEINDSALNKIFAIMTANVSNSVYENAYAFEKVVLALCSKPVHFNNLDTDNINVQNIVFAIDVLDRITPTDDIYDNFSSEVIDMIVKILANSDIYEYCPSNIVSSALEPQFKEIVNELLLKKIQNKMTMVSDDRILNSEINSNCEYIHDNSIAVINSIRRHKANSEQVDLVDTKKLVETIIAKKSLRDDLSKIIFNQVIKWLSIDRIQDTFNSDFETQMIKYGIIE